MEKKRASKKRNPQVYDPQHRRRSNQNAKGGNTNSYLKYVQICLYYGEHINSLKSPEVLLKQYEELDPLLYASILQEEKTNKGSDNQLNFLQKVKNTFNEKKQQKDLPNNIWTYNELVLELSKIFYHSEDSIASILKRTGDKFRLKSKRRYLKAPDGSSLTHQQHLEQEKARIEFMKAIHLEDIYERDYENEGDKQQDIANIDQYFEEEYKNLSLLERRAHENSQGRAYEKLHTKPNTYLARILSSPSYINYLTDRNKWNKNKTK